MYSEESGREPHNGMLLVYNVWGICIICVKPGHAHIKEDDDWKEVEEEEKVDEVKDENVDGEEGEEEEEEEEEKEKEKKK